ncbi:MAG: N-6 DNA methylase, partial [Nitrospirae bacterium]|nr:N-6 DNA methylase [Nitrospirota bacterium]
VGGPAADRYIIWVFGNKSADVLKIVISGKEGRKIRLKTLSLEAGKWFKTYDYILEEVEKKFNTSGLFQQLKEPSGLWKAIWEAFDISIVNKKFYAEIKIVFDSLVKDQLPRCKGVLINEQESIQFAIRLIGRIIFCWFLKKKGIIFDNALSSTAVRSEANYYRVILEPMFFDVFNTPAKERRKDLPESIRDYPFLNGGLFEPQPHDHKGNWALNISDDWFMDFFGKTLERYNFTIDENSASSSERAIDPEMLGRIFENLLAEQNPETGTSARKATGSYYTPREIVDFMVEESLIAYLKTNTDIEAQAIAISDSAIEDFVHTATFSDSDPLKPQCKVLLDKLNSIKVLDPACGSGAFPISMLQKLVQLKQELGQKDSLYNIKIKTIENSIYGVDIQPMATELSRLRCWLSLIVDENPKDIKPLPNLDFKFVTANSLIDLGYDEFIDKLETGQTGGIFLQQFKAKLMELRGVRHKYFESALNQKDKDHLKEEFNTIKDDLFKMSLELIRQELLDAEFATKVTGWDPFDDSKPAPFFNKNWMFGVEEGFDVVIANPPYIRHEAIKPIKPQLSKRFGKFYCGTADIYTYFYKAGIDFLKQSGHLCFIAPNKFMRAGYGKNTRTLMMTEATPKIVIDFCDLPIFDATTYPAVILLEKRQPSKNDNALAATFTTGEQLANIDGTIGTIGFKMPVTALKAEGWNLEEPPVLELINKLSKSGVPLAEYVQGRFYRGILTGLNEAFVIDAATREKLIAEDPKSDELIRPWLRGRDIKKWKAEWAGLYVIFTRRGVDIDKYPAIKRHLELFREDLEPKTPEKQKRGRKPGAYKWYEIQDNIAYYKEFDKPKIIYPNITKTNIFAFDTTGILTNQKCFIIPTDDLYLLAILNSKLAMQWFVSTLPLLRGGFFEPSAMFMEQFPVVTASEIQKAQIIECVQKILATPDNPDVPGLEAEINKLVYDLYGLTPAEIATVEDRTI